MSDAMFGVTDFGAIRDPGLTGNDLAKELDQAFTTETVATKPKKRIAARTARRVGVVKPPEVASAKPASKNPPRAGFSAGPAPKKTITKLNPDTGTFTIQQVDVQALAREAAEAKIINTLRIPAKLRTKFLAKLKANQESIAEFLFLEVATFDLAVPAGVEILNEYLHDSIDVGASVDLGRVSGMLTKISDLRTLSFLCKLCGINKADTDMLVRDMLAPPPDRVVPQRQSGQPAVLAQQSHQRPGNNRKPGGVNPMDRVGMRNALSGLLSRG